MEFARFAVHLGLEVAVEIVSLEILLRCLDEGFFHRLEHFLFGYALLGGDHLHTVEERGCN